MSVYNPATAKFTHYQKSEEFQGRVDDETIFIVHPDVMDKNILWVCATNRLYMFEEKERQERVQKWFNEGLAKFSDILSKEKEK